MDCKCLHTGWQKSQPRSLQASLDDDRRRISEVSEVQLAKVSPRLWGVKSAARRLSQKEMMDIKKSRMSSPGDADLPLIQRFEKNDVPGRMWNAH
jgi:hypothetical protein